MVSQDRVIFIRSAVQFMAQKAHIKLHAKKLYQVFTFTQVLLHNLTQLSEISLVSVLPDGKI